MSHPSESIECRVRAAKLLDLPAEATPAEARSAFLKRLDRVDFAPSDEVRAGLGLLDERVAAASFAATAVENTRRDMLGADVDEFSGDFWTLPPVQRRERWQSLWERCAKQSALLKHLQHLEPGLDVEGNGDSSLAGRGAQIAELIKGSFPLRRLERTARRQDWLAENSSQPMMWKQAASNVISAAPALAELDPVLMNELRQRPDRIAPTRSTGTAAFSSPMVFNQKPRSKKANSGTNNIGWPAYLVFMVVIGLLKAAFSSHSDRNSDPPSTPYKYQYQDRSPTYTPFPIQRSKEELEAELKHITKMADELRRSQSPSSKKADVSPPSKSSPPGDRP